MYTFINTVAHISIFNTPMRLPSLLIFKISLLIFNNNSKLLQLKKTENFDYY